ncbi:MAG: hypothetical protein HYU66_10395 [Armatimonadetes bacterium]|nr:hypothetical protein [Armatimonadota bacterium]
MGYLSSDWPNRGECIDFVNCSPSMLVVLSPELLPVFLALVGLSCFVVHRALKDETGPGPLLLPATLLLVYSFCSSVPKTLFGVGIYAAAVLFRETVQEALATWRQGPETTATVAPVDDLEPRYLLLTRAPRPPAGRGPGRNARRLSRSASSTRRPPPGSRP